MNDTDKIIQLLEQAGVNLYGLYMHHNLDYIVDESNGTVTFYIEEN